MLRQASPAPATIISSKPTSSAASPNGPDEKLVIIDEVQKLPALLDEAQTMIDRDRHLRFIFTGSSARKLRRGGANLLGGRAWVSRMHPLVAPGLDYGSLELRLNRGGLPFILGSEHPEEELNSYDASPIPKGNPAWKTSLLSQA